MSEAAPEQAKEYTEAETPRAVYAFIWNCFADEVKVSETKAYANLRERLSRKARELVPSIMTPKEHVDIIEWCQSRIKVEQSENASDPRDLMGSWLRGDGVDLCRVPLDKGTH